MCGPLGTGFCLFISIFGALFMGAMAIMIGNNYEYLGEWYDATGAGASYEVQRADAQHNCWLVAGVYAAFGVVSAVGSCYHAFRKRV